MQKAILLLTVVLSFAECARKSDDDKFEQQLEPWQLETARKETKNILDYYLLLPKKVLIGMMVDFEDSKEFRIESANQKNPIQGYVNLQDGYLVASPDAYIQMALFVDRAKNKKIVGIVIGCGEFPVQYCEYKFLEFNDKELSWEVNSSVFPWADFEEKCKTLSLKKDWGNKTTISPFIQLPEKGTTIKVFDSDEGNFLFNMAWSGTEFIIEN